MFTFVTICTIKDGDNDKHAHVSGPREKNLDQDNAPVSQVSSVYS